MRTRFASLVMFALLASACEDDDSPATTTESGDNGTSADTGTMSADTTAEGGTSSCEPVDESCEAECGKLYDCGIEEGCMFSGAQDERDAFIAQCSAEASLCPTIIGIVDECNCSGTVTTASAANPDYAMACAEGFGAGSSSGSDSSGSDSSGSDSSGSSSTGDPTGSSTGGESSSSGGAEQ